MAIIDRVDRGPDGSLVANPANPPVVVVSGDELAPPWPVVGGDLSVPEDLSQLSAWRVVVASDLDVAGAVKLRQAARRITGERKRRLHVDLRDVAFVDCAGINEVGALLAEAERLGMLTELTLGPAVIRVLSMLAKAGVAPAWWVSR